MHQEKIGFLLKQVDDWPPVEVEHLWLEPVGDAYIVKNFPLFIEGIAYLDQIQPCFDERGYVTSWETTRASDHSLLWIFEREPTDVLDKLNALGCGVESGKFTKISAVNVPSSVDLKSIELILQPEEDSGNISVAYPVDRFQEPQQ